MCSLQNYKLTVYQKLNYSVMNVLGQRRRQFVSFDATLHTKMKFCIKFPADLVKFTEEILDAKLHYLCNAITSKV